MPEILVNCDAGCRKPFTINEMPTLSCDQSDIEHTFFTCPHCGQIYTVNYTNTEIRKLQERMRRLHRRFSDPWANYEDVKKKEAELRILIKEKMDALRKQVE